MTSSEGGPPVWAPWAKSVKAGAHPLVCHVVDTTAVAFELYDVLLGPAARRGLESGFAALGDPRTWVAMLCGWHDIGKYTPVFQAMSYQRAVKGFGEHGRRYLDRIRDGAQQPGVKTHHGVLTAVYFRAALAEWGATLDVQDAVAYVLGGHHGLLLSAYDRQAAAAMGGHNGGPKWRRWQDELVRTTAKLWDLGDPAEAPWDQVSLDVPAAVGLAGLTSVSDWIASDSKRFPYAERPDDDLDDYPVKDFDEYRATAMDQARRAVREKMRWRPWVPPADRGFQSLFPDNKSPRRLQTAVERAASEATSPGVLVVEAPTGEGKTLAALQAAAIWVGKFDLAGMYMALPTKATAHHIHGELGKHGPALGFDGAPNLVHSGVPRASTAASPTGVAQDESGEGQAVAREWFTRKAGLLFPIGAGTIDQALQAVIQSLHVFVRMTALSNKVLVVDEVHALDTYMSTLLNHLMWWCGRQEIPVILLSATLPATRREDLIAHWRAGNRILAPTEVPPDSPGVGGWQVTFAGPGPENHPPIPFTPDRVNKERQIQLDQIRDDDVLPWLRQRIGTSGCALVIHDLVARASNTYEQLREEIKTWENPPELVYLTGKVADGERAKTEAWIRENFGPEADRPHAIIVGTQILQHSLDIDLDVLVSDLCPIDILIQRAGRLHRHDRLAASRAVAEPTIGLIAPQENRDGLRFPRGLHTVYPHELLWRTWDLLLSRSTLALPTETAKLVHEVYVEGTGPIPLEHTTRRNRAVESLHRQTRNEQYEAGSILVPPLPNWMSVRELTSHPTTAARTRKSSHRDEDRRG